MQLLMKAQYIETDPYCKFLGPKTLLPHFNDFCQFLAPEIVKTVPHNFWTQKLRKWVSFWGQKLIQFHSFWSRFSPTEFWPIETEKNNLNIVWIMYEFNRNKKNPFELKLAHFNISWIQKLTVSGPRNCQNVREILY